MLFALTEHDTFRHCGEKVSTGWAKFRQAAVDFPTTFPVELSGSAAAQLRTAILIQVASRFAQTPLWLGESGVKLYFWNIGKTYVPKVVEGLVASSFTEIELFGRLLGELFPDRDADMTMSPVERRQIVTFVQEHFFLLEDVIGPYYWDLVLVREAMKQVVQR